MYTNGYYIRNLSCIIDTFEVNKKCMCIYDMRNKIDALSLLKLKQSLLKLSYKTSPNKKKRQRS